MQVIEKTPKKNCGGKAIGNTQNLIPTLFLNKVLVIKASAWTGQCQCVNNIKDTSSTAKH